MRTSRPTGEAIERRAITGGEIQDSLAHLDQAVSGLYALGDALVEWKDMNVIARTGLGLAVQALADVALNCHDELDQYTVRAFQSADQAQGRNGEGLRAPLTQSEFPEPTEHLPAGGAIPSARSCEHCHGKLPTSTMRRRFCSAKCQAAVWRGARKAKKKGQGGSGTA
jgi:hypothetical protein